MFQYRRRILHETTVCDVITRQNRRHDKTAIRMYFTINDANQNKAESKLCSASIMIKNVYICYLFVRYISGWENLMHYFVIESEDIQDTSQ